MPSLFGGTVARSCAPCTMKRPAGTGTRSARLALTQSLAPMISKDIEAATSAPAAFVTSSRRSAWSGASAKCSVRSQRPSGRSNAAIAASPSKKTSSSRSATRLADFSSPMAKLARWVAGVRGGLIAGLVEAALSKGFYRRALDAASSNRLGARDNYSLFKALSGSDAAVRLRSAATAHRLHIVIKYQCIKPKPSSGLAQPNALVTHRVRIGCQNTCPSKLGRRAHRFSTRTFTGSSSAPTRFRVAPSQRQRDEAAVNSRLLVSPLLHRLVP